MNGHGNTGQIRVIEAVLALFIVFSAFTLSSGLTATQNSSRIDELTSVGVQYLTALDSSGVLFGDVEVANWTNLREVVAMTLPSGLIFNLTVLDRNLTRLNTDGISNGVLGEGDVVCVEYLCVGGVSELHWYILRLYLGVPT